MPSRSFARARLPLAFAALAALAALGTPAYAQAANDGGAAGGSSSCAGRFHAALRDIRNGPYQEIGRARPEARQADDRLPGALLFVPPFRSRSTAERLALQEANQIAHARGRPGWSSSGDDRWIVKRVTGEVGDYLAQDETPFLCGGVSNYVATLRAYLTRVGGNPQRTADLLAAQRGAAEASIRAALDAMRPVPIPQQAPARPQPQAPDGLRPSAGIGPAVVSPDSGSGSAAAKPGLPPATPPKPIALDTDTDRIAALDALVDAARKGGFLRQEAPGVAAAGNALLTPAGSRPVGGSPAAGDEPRPVLARLAALKPLVIGTDTPIKDVVVRRALVAAFSDIEALDYLEHRPSDAEGSVLNAIDDTLNAISAAHKANCTCMSGK
ncbi:hypothetical protein [Jiella sp. M17.18]|uniref:hypothetical protein n=1 Tax=Jiella sp. M17.18 TaxID=3234247 RepID=UPI0034DF5A80